MSRANIINITPDPEEGIVEVTFSLKDGGTAVYIYEMVSGAAIMAGADPKNFPGTRIA